jgi:hypothetical protein
MKKKYILFKVYIPVIVILSFSFFNCDEAPQDYNLAVPSNVNVEVVGRWFNVSWNTVSNASGYEIYTTSTGCGSGNRIINTATETATNHEGTAVTSTYPSNGSVEFISATSIRIWLMPAEMGSAEPMASAVSAKVKALGTGDYIDSAYSSETSVAKADYLPAE